MGKDYNLEMGDLPFNEIIPILIIIPTKVLQLKYGKVMNKKEKDSKNF